MVYLLNEVTQNGITKVAGTILHMESAFLLSFNKSKQLMDQAHGV